MILSQCVFICLHVNIGLMVSMLRIKFYQYRLIATEMPSNEISSLREQFCEPPGSIHGELKCLHSEVLTEIHCGRLLVLLVELLGLTDEEWEQLFDFLVHTLSQIQE